MKYRSDLFRHESGSPVRTQNAPGDLASELERLAEGVSRLRPDWRDASRFYEARSEVVGALRALSRNPPATRVLTRFVQVPVPAPTLPPAPARPSRPARAGRHRLPHPGSPQGQGAFSWLPAAT